MQIQQLSVTYQPEQDRLLLRVGSSQGEELRLWFTRRLIGGLWPHLDRLQSDQLLRSEPAGAAAAADPGVRRALTEFRRDAVLEQADFGTPYREPVHRPLGDEPVLVTDVELTPLADGRVRLALRERLERSGGRGGRALGLELDATLMQGLLRLVEQGLAKSGWREPMSATAPAAAPQAAERPTLLN